MYRIFFVEDDDKISALLRDFLQVVLAKIKRVLRQTYGEYAVLKRLPPPTFTTSPDFTSTATDK